MKKKTQFYTNCQNSIIYTQKMFFFFAQDDEQIKFTNKKKTKAANGRWEGVRRYWRLHNLNRYLSTLFSFWNIDDKFLSIFRIRFHIHRIISMIIFSISRQIVDSFRSPELPFDSSKNIQLFMGQIDVEKKTRSIYVHFLCELSAPKLLSKIFLCCCPSNFHLIFILSEKIKKVLFIVRSA